VFWSCDQKIEGTLGQHLIYIFQGRLRNTFYTGYPFPPLLCEVCLSVYPSIQTLHPSIQHSISMVRLSSYLSLILSNSPSSQHWIPPTQLTKTGPSTRTTSPSLTLISILKHTPKTVFPVPTPPSLVISPTTTTTSPKSKEIKNENAH
jgi:hypothetical protein